MTEVSNTINMFNQWRNTCDHTVILKQKEKGLHMNENPQQVRGDT